MSTLAKTTVDMKPGMVVAFSECGLTARLVAKYRPAVPVLIVTSNTALAKQCQIMFGLHVMQLPAPVKSMKDMKDAVHDALIYGSTTGLCVPGKEVVVMTSNRVTTSGVNSIHPERRVYVTTCPGKLDMNKLGKLAPTRSSQVRVESIPLCKAMGVSLDGC